MRRGRTPASAASDGALTAARKRDGESMVPWIAGKALYTRGEPISMTFALKAIVWRGRGIAGVDPARSTAWPNLSASKRRVRWIHSKGRMGHLLFADHLQR